MKPFAVEGRNLHAGGPRQAALMLHGMQSQDRLWLLDQLPPNEQQQLAMLLGELAELGIPSDPSFMREAISSAQDATKGRLHTLCAEELAQLAVLLRGEPPGFVAQLLSIEAWPWEADLLGRLSPIQRRQITEHRTLNPAHGTPHARFRRQTAIVHVVERSLRMAGERHER